MINPAKRRLYVQMLMGNETAVDAGCLCLRLCVCCDVQAGPLCDGSAFDAGEYLVTVFGVAESTFSLLASTREDAITLIDGAPQQVTTSLFSVRCTRTPAWSKFDRQTPLLVKDPLIMRSSCHSLSRARVCVLCACWSNRNVPSVTTQAHA